MAMISLIFIFQSRAPGIHARLPEVPEVAFGARRIRASNGSHVALSRHLLSFLVFETADELTERKRRASDVT